MHTRFLPNMDLHITKMKMPSCIREQILASILPNGLTVYKHMRQAVIMKRFWHSHVHESGKGLSRYTPGYSAFSKSLHLTRKFCLLLKTIVEIVMLFPRKNTSANQIFGEPTHGTIFWIRISTTWTRRPCSDNNTISLALYVYYAVVMCNSSPSMSDELHDYNTCKK